MLRARCALARLWAVRHARRVTSLRLTTPTDRPTDRPTAVVDTSVWDGAVFRDHQDVVLADGVVTDVRDHVPGADGLDGRGGYLLPGFVNTHTHLQQATCRGVGEGRQLLQWLLAVGEHMSTITPERAYLAAVSAALEGLRSGTTTLVEHMWPHPSNEVHEAVLRALDDVGVRAVFGRGIADRTDPTRKWGFDPRLVQPLEDVLAHVDTLRSAAEGSRVQVALAVPNPRCLTPEGMRTVREFAVARDLTVMIHLLETTTDDVMCREHVGVGAVEHLADNDFLWNRLLAVHCVELSADGIAQFARNGVAVAYNPLSNMRLGSGVAPVLEMLEAGVGVGLGVDGAGSNDRQDALESLRAGAYLQRAHRKRADVLDAAAMIAMATGGAHSVLAGADTSSGVVAGLPADLTLVRFERDFATLPVTDPAASLLTTGSPRIVDTVLVAGEVVVADGTSTRIDEAALVRELSALR